jgi:hypothetical protein
MLTTSPTNKSGNPGTKQLSKLAICFGFFFIAAVGCSQPPAPVVDAPVSQPGTVTVVFAMPDGEVRRELETVAAGTTIADVLAKIDDPKIEITGTGEMAFVKSIGELGTTEGEGWTFKVDGKWADRGIGAYELSPPATIQWSHGKFDPADQ